MGGGSSRRWSVFREPGAGSLLSMGRSNRDRMSVSSAGAGSQGGGGAAASGGGAGGGGGGGGGGSGLAGRRRSQRPPTIRLHHGEVGEWIVVVKKPCNSQSISVIWDSRFQGWSGRKDLWRCQFFDYGTSRVLLKQLCEVVYLLG